MTRLFIGLAAAFCLATPLAAQNPGAPAAAATPAPARVSIRFNPPLDRPLLYRATVTKPRDGGQETVWIDYAITFSRRPGGFRMQVTTLNAGAPDLPVAQAGMIRRMLVDLAPPYVLLLNADAAIESMEDGDAYWERMLALTEQVIRQEGSGGRPPSDTAISQSMAMMRQTSPAARIQLVTQYIAPILNFAAADFVIGEALTGDEQFDGPMGISLVQRSSVTPQRVENGRLFLAVDSRVPEEEMRRAISNFMASIPTSGQGNNTPSAREQVAAQLRDARFDRQSRAAYEIVLESGLTQRFEGTDRVEIDMGGEQRTQVTTIRLERRD